MTTTPANLPTTFNSAGTMISRRKPDEKSCRMMMMVCTYSYRYSTCIVVKEQEKISLLLCCNEDDIKDYKYLLKIGNIRISLSLHLKMTGNERESVSGNGDTLDSLFEWTEKTCCPATMREYQPEQKPDTLDYVFEHVVRCFDFSHIGSMKKASDVSS